MNYSNASLDDVLTSIGLRSRPTSNYDAVLPALAVFSAGLLTGAAAAVLLTPKTGTQMRHDIADGAVNLKNRIQTAVPGIPDPEDTHTAALTQRSEAFAK